MMDNAREDNLFKALLPVLKLIIMPSVCYLKYRQRYMSKFHGQNKIVMLRLIDSRKCISLPDITCLKPFLEPIHPLFRCAVCKGIWHDMTL